MNQCRITGKLVVDQLNSAWPSWRCTRCLPAGLVNVIRLLYHLRQRKRFMVLLDCWFAKPCACDVANQLLEFGICIPQESNLVELAARAGTVRTSSGGPHNTGATTKRRMLSTRGLSRDRLAWFNLLLTARSNKSASGLLPGAGGCTESFLAGIKTQTHQQINNKTSKTNSCEYQPCY